MSLRSAAHARDNRVGHDVLCATCGATCICQHASLNLKGRSPYLHPTTTAARMRRFDRQPKCHVEKLNYRDCYNLSHGTQATCRSLSRIAKKARLYDPKPLTDSCRYSGKCAAFALKQAPETRMCALSPEKTDLAVTHRQRLCENAEGEASRLKALVRVSKLEPELSSLHVHKDSPEIVPQYILAIGKCEWSASRLRLVRFNAPAHRAVNDQALMKIDVSSQQRATRLFFSPSRMF